MVIDKFGLECYDKDGNQTVSVVNQIYRLAYTAEVAADDTDSIELPQIDGKTTVQFGLALEAEKHGHHITRSGNTITWTARDDSGVLPFCSGGPVWYGYESSITQIFVYMTN
jgi:hypothetical protein